MFGKLAFVAALLAAPAAWAQDSAPPTTAEVAAATAHADLLIVTAGATDLFVNVSESGVPKAKHTASGMICSFSGDENDRITAYPASPGISRGEDVSCGSRVLGTEVTIYATKYAANYTAEQVIGDAVAAIRQRLPDARPHPGGISVASREGMTTPLAAGFDFDLNGTPRLTLVFVVHQGPWSFKARATGPLADDTVNLMAAITFLQSVPEAQ